MRNTLFSKYFAICAGLIMATLVFVGGTFLVLTSNNFRAEKYEFLKRNTDIAAALTLNNYRENGQSYIERDIVTTSYSILAGACDAEFFLTDAQGKTMLCTEGYACRHRSYTIPDRILDKAVAGSFSDLGFLGGIYKGQYFTVASPVILEDGQLLGVVFASTSAKSLTLSSMHTVARAYRAVPAGWHLFLYEDEIVLRARDYAAHQWLTAYDEIIPLKKRAGI